MMSGSSITVWTVICMACIVFLSRLRTGFLFKRAVGRVNTDGLDAAHNNQIIRFVIRGFRLMPAEMKNAKTLADLFGVEKPHIKYILSFIRKSSDKRISGGKFTQPDEIVLLNKLGLEFTFGDSGQLYVGFADGLDSDRIFFHKALSLMRIPVFQSGGQEQSSEDPYYRQKLDEYNDRALAARKGQHMGGYRNGDGRNGQW